MLPSQPASLNSQNPQPDNNSLPKKQKIAVISLAVLGLAVIIFWAWQFQARVSGPFSVPKSERQPAATTTDTTKDTDGDGLTDYEELNIYNTSPYLADSDSDGLPDGQETKNGTDPNCPAGQKCGLEAVQPPAQTVTSTIIQETTLPTGAETSASTTVEERLVNGQITASELRQLLLDNGADKTSLDKISDPDLLQAYQEMLQAKLDEVASSTSSQSQ